jgi:hypothetical protein
MKRDISYYVLLKKTPQLWERYVAGGGSVDLVESLFKGNWTPSTPGLINVFSVETLPSNDVWVLGQSATRASYAQAPQELVVGVSVDRGAIELFHDEVNLPPKDGPPADPNPIQIRGGAIDLPLGITEHWCPGESADPIFGDSEAALALLRIPEFQAENGTDGQDVNVVIVDQGLDRVRLPNYVDGWRVGSVIPVRQSVSRAAIVAPMAR